MDVRVIVRAASIVGFALTAWASNVRWGSDAAVRGGPPIQWERHAVGAALLSAAAALAVWLATRAGVGPSRLYLRAAACVLALGVGAIALYLKVEASRLDIGDVLAGPGWPWLVAGAGVSTAAAAGSFAVGGAAPRPTSQRSRGRKRGAAPRAR